MSDSYDAAENSVDQGQPYFLYLFDNGVSPVRLTSNPDELIRMDQKWTPSPIQHADIEQTGNIERNEVEMTFPLSDTYARTLLIPASEITVVTVWRGHLTDLTNTLRVVWKGRVVPSKSAKQNIKVSVESVYTSLRRPGCRARYQRTCRHSLYFTGCTLNIDDFKVPATVTAANGLTLTIPEAALQPNGTYKAGVVIFNGLFGWIEDHTGSTITLAGGVVNGLNEAVAADGSASVFIAPGCDLSEETCTRLGNWLNMGGFKNMSDNNPFSQSIT
ncbi:DUF2163 domain-containing protein [Mesorhizobium sp. M2A.F.Ca.ET.015.02.1.1]|uniref:baseplate hub domain-containing protein n=1 Tax=Mesorhizobium sp. M2A.F.Ca.ET.015.02.1.1 TaxID=2496758 RepID=UPI000FCB2E93|nr:DUF2163 domain-containing protein [Mesorhizobium sp. M2A.F.Ca.ET.015.02.1.1]RUW41530.1 DUF2163 domain-containing protein [Mesorhizobium sp. M2A.F.Ca.ET.015.02.1.1]